jgi:hypothetical protein
VPPPLPVRQPQQSWAAQSPVARQWAARSPAAQSPAVQSPAAQPQSAAGPLAGDNELPTLADSEEAWW